MKNRPIKNLWMLLPIRSMLFVASFALCNAVTKKSLSDITHWWSIIASVLNIITIGILLLVCRINNTTFLDLILYEKKKEKVSIGVWVVVAMLLLGMGGMYLSGWLCYGQLPYLAPMIIAPIPLALAILNVFVLPITTTLAEDGLYLGCGVNGFKSKWLAILVTAFFYALQHSFIPTIVDAQYVVYRFLSFLPLTLWICYHYYHRKNPLYIMVGHCILNIATTLQIVVTSAMPGLYDMMRG